MAEYSIYATELYLSIYEALDGSEKIWLDKMKKQLGENPSGKILRFSWFREKKYLNKRLYYLIDEDLKKILFVAFGSKKEQEKTIRYVLEHMEELLDYLRGV